MCKGMCAKCKIVSLNGMLHIHHMDFNHLNDIETNRLILCSNCHRDLHNNKWKLEDIGLVTPKTLSLPASEFNLSPQQLKALDIMTNISKDLTPNDLYSWRWFHQGELPEITLHSLKSLVQKGILEEMECKTTGHIYYRIK